MSLRFAYRTSTFILHNFKSIVLTAILLMGAGFTYSAYADNGPTISGSTQFGSTPFTNSTNAAVQFLATDGSGIVGTGYVVRIRFD